MAILIVDDDFVSRNLLSLSLEGLGPRDQACNAEEGWRAFLAAHAGGAPYSLILLDIMMPPGADGMELLRRIRAHEEGLGLRGGARARIAMSTSLTDREHVLGSFRDECDGYITKPYSPDSVLEDLRRHGLLGEGPR